MSGDLAKLHELCQKTYKEQGVWFLNCFWEDFAEKEAETVWQYVNTNATLDLENHEEGCGLDEMKAHVFLEKFDETLTVREMRAKLRSTGAIGESERPKTVPLTHYLLYKYNADWHTLVDETRQGDNAEEMAKAEEMLEQVTKAFKESEARASEARTALNAAVSAENSAKSREEEAVASENQAVARENEAVQQENEAVQRESEAKASEKEAQARDASAKESHAKSQEKEAVAKKDAAAAVEREAEAKSAQSELEAALAELHAEEKAYNDKKESLEKKSQEGGVVSMNKAKNELAQHLAEDPLPLRRAKITVEAAVKRAEKTSNAAAAARQSAESSATEASNARVAAEKAAAEASQAREIAEKDAAAASKAREAAVASRESASAARSRASKDRETASSAREAAEQARQASENAKIAADKALDDASRKLKEAEDYLEEVKSKPGASFGALWWIDRELHEQRKYLPVSKGGIAK